MIRYAQRAIAVLLMTWPVAAPAADTYPVKPIRLIVTFPPGGSTDVVARAIQPALEQRLGQPIIIDNRPGAGGNIGTDAVAKAAPDGYTLGFSAAGALAVNVSLNDKMPYDPIKDLAPVTLVGASPFILAAHPSFDARSITDVIAQAKAKPGGLTIGHGGNGTAMHLTAELFNHMAGIKLTLVPYRGTGPVVADLLAGHVPLGIVDAPSAIGQIRAGQVKAIAVTSLKRTPLLPEVPTFDQSGLPRYESIGWYGIVAPAGTPPEIVGKLNAALVAVLKEADIQERIRSVGAEPSPMTTAEFGDFIRSEMKKWAEVTARAGIKTN